MESESKLDAYLRGLEEHDKASARDHEALGRAMNDHADQQFRPMVQDMEQYLTGAVGKIIDVSAVMEKTNSYGKRVTDICARSARGVVVTLRLVFEAELEDGDIVYSLGASCTSMLREGLQQGPQLLDISGAPGYQVVEKDPLFEIIKRQAIELFRRQARGEG